MKSLKLILLLLLNLQIKAQYDSTKPLQTISAQGYTWRNADFLNSLGIPLDTLKLAVKDSGSLAYKGGKLWNYTGYVWELAQGQQPNLNGLWSLTGNSSIDPLTNFIGTKVNNSLRFRTNNVERMKLDSTGHLFLYGKTVTDASQFTIGTMLDVSGSGGGTISTLRIKPSVEGFTTDGSGGHGPFEIIASYRTKLRQVGAYTGLDFETYNGFKFITPSGTPAFLFSLQKSTVPNVYVRGDGRTHINDNGDTTSKPSVLLDLESTTKGLLVPRLTSAQMNAISGPAISLLIYNYDSGFCYHNGSAWVKLAGGGSGGGSGSVISVATGYGLSGGTITSTGTLVWDSATAFLAALRRADSNLYTTVYQNGLKWGINGNSGLSSSNFIGTTDNVPLSFRVNNTLSGRVNSTGETLWGYEAGYNNSYVGTSAFGYQAARSNTDGSANTALGYRSLYSNVDEDNNTAVGYRSLYFSTGGGNTSVGSNSLYSNTTGYDNTAVGLTSLQLNTTGIRNTGIGGLSIFSNTTGSNNTALGYVTLSSNTTGDYNVGIGYGANVATTSTSEGIAIGHNATAASNQLAFAPAITTIKFPGLSTGAGYVLKDVAGNGVFTAQAETGGGGGSVDSVKGKSPKIIEIKYGATKDSILLEAPTIVFTGDVTGSTTSDSTATLTLASSIPGQHTFTERIIFTPTSTFAGMRLAGATADPTGPGNGDIWYRSDIGAYRSRTSSTNRTLANLDEAQTFTNKNFSDASNTFPTWPTASIANSAITYAKIQNLSGTSKLLGSSSTTTPVQEITIGSGLSLSGTTLTATASGSGTVSSGAQYRISYYATAGTTLSNAAAITANRALISDANGVPTHSAVTNTELGYVSGVTSAIQTQLNAKGSGTVTNFSAGDLSPLFTTSEATTTSTPALTFSLSNAAAHTFLGNNTGSTGAPSYSAINQADVTNLTTDLAAKAPLASPTFTGTPSMPTGTTGVTQTAKDSSTKLATTAYVDVADAAMFIDSPKHTLSVTPTFTGTAAPSGTATNTYEWRKNKKIRKVDAWFWLNYSSAGTSVSQVDIQLPADMPTPDPPAGFTSANDIVFPGNKGWLYTLKTNWGTDMRGESYIRYDGTNYFVVIKNASANSINMQYGWAYVSYTTAN